MLTSVYKLLSISTYQQEKLNLKNDNEAFHKDVSNAYIKTTSFKQLLRGYKHIKNLSSPGLVGAIWFPIK